MTEKNSAEERLNPARLRTMAQVSVGWVILLSLIPNFFMRILDFKMQWVSAAAWTVGVVLFTVLTAFLCFRILRGRKILLLVYSGLFLIVASQIYRIVFSLDFFDNPTFYPWHNMVGAFDNLISGLGISLVVLAFLYAIIELLASRQQIMAEHAVLSAEVARREQAEKCLLEREALLQGISTSALDGIIVMNNEGRVSYWNPAAERILGYGAEEMIGKYLHETMVPPHSVQEYARGISEWQRTGEGPVVGRSLTLKAMKKNGQETDVELSVASMNISGQWHAVGILRDITQRLQAEKDYKTILQTAMDGFWLLDLEGKILEVNDAYCRFSGYSREEMLNMRIQDLEAKETPEEVARHIQEVHKKGLDRFETQHRRKDGAIIDVEVSSNGTVYLGSGNRQCAFLRDISETKRALAERRNLEAQVRYAQKLESLGVLAGGIAHDFNNILQIILGNVNLLEKTVPETSPLRPFINNIHKSVERAASVTRQMLAYTGKKTLSLAPLDLSSVAGEIIEMVHLSISKKVMVQMNLAKGLPLIEGDITQVQQIVMNLVLNAAEAQNDEHGGLVTVSTTILHGNEDYLKDNRTLDRLPEGDYVCLEVSDTGSGMDEEALEKLFDPFYTTKFTGRGLGMSAVLGIIRSHKGGILVESNPGEGTTIRALFPALAEQTLLEPDGAMHISPAAPVKGNSILFVDDEPDMRDLGILILQQAGYSVLPAADGMDAIEIFKARHKDIHCVLLDLSMPRMDGGQALLELRRINPDIQVILMSGYSMQKLEEKFSGQGVSAFLEKPYDAQSLLDKLREVLG